MEKGSNRDSDRGKEAIVKIEGERERERERDGGRVKKW